MGLSNEERMTKFLWCMQGWRKKVVDLQESLGRKEEKSRRVVGSWVKRIDGMTGEIVQGANRNSAYWLLGENEGSFHGLMSNPYDLRSDAEPDSYSVMGESKYETAGWWSSEVDFSFVASRIVFPPYKSHEGLAQLAKWWDQHGYVSAIIYPVWRYDDDLFSKRVKNEFQKLIGEMTNLRFEVCFSEYGDKTDQHRIETYLLLKSKAFHLLLQQETKKLKGAAYLEKKFNGYALFKKVAAMSALDLKNLFDAESKRKWDWDRKYHKDEDAKKVEKASGLFGPVVKKKEEEEETSAKPQRRRRRGR